MPRAASFFSMMWLPESARRCSTRRRCAGLSSGRTTMCIGAVIQAWANALSSQLPRCAVATRTPRPASLACVKVFEAFVTNPSMKCFARLMRGKRAKVAEQARDGAEHSVGDGVAFGRSRRCQFQIAHGDAAQAGHGEIEQPGVERATGREDGYSCDGEAAAIEAHSTQSSRRPAPVRRSKTPRLGRA